MWSGVVPAVIIFIITAIIGWGWKIFCRGHVRKKIKKKEHEEHHKMMTSLPEIFEKHQAIHESIANELEQARITDIETMRTQLCQLHHVITNGTPNTIYFKRQFYELYKVYELRGGNSFAPELKQDVDNTN